MSFSSRGEGLEGARRCVCGGQGQERGDCERRQGVREALLPKILALLDSKQTVYSCGRVRAGVAAVEAAVER